jgi:hypothetical protein
VAGGALPMSAGTSPHGRRKPNGSACQRRTMAGVQDAAKHAIRAMSPLKSFNGLHTTPIFVDVDSRICNLPGGVPRAFLRTLVAPQAFLPDRRFAPSRAVTAYSGTLHFGFQAISQR